MRLQSFRPTAWAALSLLLFLAPGRPVTAESTDPPPLKSPPPRVRILQVHREGSGVEVSFRIENAFDAKIKAKLASGLPISFVHQVEVRRRRVFWFPRTLAEKKITTTAVLDTLTGQYTLTRKADGAMVETITTSDVSEMRGFMTHVEAGRLSLPGSYLLFPHAEIRVRTRLETRFFVLLPYDYKTEWSRRPLVPAGEGHG